VALARLCPQTGDFERRQKEFFESLSLEEMKNMVDSINRCMDHLSSTDKPAVSVEARSDPGLRSKLPN
jgi:hypothetical protein